MHYTTLSAASILALASSVYADSYGVAQVSVLTHNGCGTGEYPSHKAPVSTSSKSAATKDTCSRIKVKHDFGITSYSVSAELITPKSNCYGVGVYTNEDCDGIAESVAFFDSHTHKAQSVCFPKRAFGKHVGIKLLCDEKKPHVRVHAAEEHAAVEHAPEEHAAAEPVPEEHAAAEPVPEEHAAAEPVPEEQAAVEPVPEEQAAAEPVPEEQAAAEPVPEEQAAAEPVPEEHAAVEHTPEEQADVKHAPEEQANAAPAPEARTAEAPAQGEKAQEQNPAGENPADKPAQEQKPAGEGKPAEEGKKDEDTKKQPLEGMIDFLRKLGL